MAPVLPELVSYLEALPEPHILLDRQYRINTRVPYLLTQKLLPSLIARQGQNRMAMLRGLRK